MYTPLCVPSYGLMPGGFYGERDSLLGMHNYPHADYWSGRHKQELDQQCCLYQLRVLGTYIDGEHPCSRQVGSC